MEKCSFIPHDPSLQLLQTLQKLLPGAIVETVVDGQTTHAVDAGVLQALLNTPVVNQNAERYTFTWPGKQAAGALANLPSFMALRPNREKSLHFSTTRNLFIEGENLEVLRLLRETYLNQVKIIYIDPPYNTGNDYLYPDDFPKRRRLPAAIGPV